MELRFLLLVEKKRNTIVLCIVLVGLFLFNFILSTLVVTSTVTPLSSSPTISAAAVTSQNAVPVLKNDNLTSVNNHDDVLSLAQQHPQQTQQQEQYQPHHKKKRLEFVHIPKTGGTVIERIALQQANISWGANHFVLHRPNTAHRRKLDVPFWHFPPTYFRNASFDPHGPSPYTNATLFTVVRNPYARVVSEYLFFRREKKRQTIKLHDVDAMNAWLSHTLQLIKRTLQMGVPHPFQQNIGNNTTITAVTMDTSDQWNKTDRQGPNFKKGYYFANGHFIPQYDYVYDGVPPQHQPVIQHVLHFETLHEEFAALMEMYGLDDLHLEKPKMDTTKPKTAIGVDDLTEENRRLIEAIYVRDFAAFDYDMLAPDPIKAQAEKDALRQKNQYKGPGLEFVHIPKTGGTAIEAAAWKAKPQKTIRWGAYQYNQNRAKEQRRWLEVPYWHLPPSHYQRDPIDSATVIDKDVPAAVLAEFDPHGPSPYENATLFTVVRNPYARAVSEYLFYHREVRHQQLEQYNRIDKLNNWLSSTLRRMEQALRDPNSNNRKYTIDTAGHWNKPHAMDMDFVRPYFNSLGHFIPQYDFVYDTVATHNGTNNDDDDDDEEERLPPPPKPVIQHVLHFENLHEEFAALMAQYNLSHVKLPNPHENKNQSATAETKPSIVGVANLTQSTRRLIEKVYARDFAAFGYEIIKK